LTSISSLLSSWVLTRMLFKIGTKTNVMSMFQTIMGISNMLNPD
jgi:hypothetical protein